MTWSEYLVVFTTDRGQIERYVRAISQRDAKWRVVRKYQLPYDATIVSVTRVQP